MVDVGLYIKIMDSDFNGFKALCKAGFCFKDPGVGILYLTCGCIEFNRLPFYPRFSPWLM
jgi:hypothetical protein